MPSYLHETREQSIMWVLSKVKNIPDNVAMLKVHHRNIASWLPLEVNPIIAFQMTNNKKKRCEASMDASHQNLPRPP